MTTPILPDYVAPFKPVPNVTPFTIRDGATMLKKLDNMKDYIQRVLIPWINENFEELADDFETQVNFLITQVNAALATQSEQVDVKITELEAFVNAAVDSIIGNSIELQEVVFTSLLKSKAKIIDVNDFDGLVPDGTNIGAAITAALATAVDGDTLMFSKGGDYPTANIDIPVANSVTVDFTGTTIINQGTTGAVISFIGSYDGMASITALSETDIPANDWNSSILPGIAITTLADMGWERGDVVKIISDDPLEGQRDMGTVEEDPDVQARYGQHLIVDSAVGTTVVLAGKLREFSKYATNVRAARLPKHRLRIIAPTIDLPAGVADPGGRGGIEIQNMYQPELINPHVYKTSGGAIIMTSNMGYTIDNAVIDAARDNAATSSFGYGIIDIGSEYGRINSPYAAHVRHAFTDDSVRGAANRTTPGAYGRTFGTIINGGQAFATTSVAWDTHSHGENVRFIGCLADSCYRGFQLRGIRHMIANGKAYDCETAIVSNDEHANGGWSWGHTIDGFDAVRCDTVLSFANNGAGHPDEGDRESRADVVRNLSATEAKRAFYVSNKTVHASNIRIAVSGDPDSNSIVLITGSGRLRAENIKLDFGNFVPALPIVNIATASADALWRGWELFHSGALVNGLVSTLNSTSHFRDGRTSSAITSTLLEGTTLSYTANDGTRPAVRAITTATLLAATFVPMIADVEAQTVVGRFALTSAANLPAIPNGRTPGQRLLLINTSGSQTITIAGGVGTNVQLNASATTYDLLINTTIEFVWNGTTTWIQV